MTAAPQAGPSAGQTMAHGAPNGASGSGDTPTWHSNRVPAPGVFLVMDKAKQAARAKGLDIIDLSIGTSDLRPPPEALDTLRAALDDPATHQYCLKSHTREFRQAAVEWYRRTYGVQLDPDTQALSLVGSQEGLAHLLLAVADPGQGVLMPEVGYPSYFGAAQVAGLEPVLLPVDPVTFLPQLQQLPSAVAQALPRCRVLLLNYPNNPTAAVADEGFFQEALEFCRRHGLLLVHDNPYALQVYDNSAAASPLSLPGAASHCVELFSCSKSYQLGGFRLGFALGNAHALAALEAVKAPIDFNQYLGIQRMGATCLSLPSDCTAQYNREWARRAAALTAALRQHCGWELAPPKACMYVWVRLPAGLPLDDVAFCQQLVMHSGVAAAPGSGFGPGGRGCIRFALVAPEEVLVAAAAAAGRFLEQLQGCGAEGRQQEALEQQQQQQQQGQQPEGDGLHHGEQQRQQQHNGLGA